MSSTSFTLLKTDSKNAQIFETSLSTLKELDISLAKKLQLPEKLCKKRAKKLEGVTDLLTPDHPLFNTINRRIEKIQEYQTKIRNLKAKS